MNWHNRNFITREDLGVAYRKAKADLYYERGHHNLFALLEYEQQLTLNLGRLHARLNSGDLQSWMTEPAFVGTWSVIAKKLSRQRSEAETSALRRSNPDEAWDAQMRAVNTSSSSANDKTPSRPRAEFRPVGVHSIDMHVVGALWMLKVGRLYDAALGETAYGSRLRASDPRSSRPVRREHGRLLLGSFRPYFQPFREWRENGLSAMRKALEEGKRVISITADACQFYHRIDPAFLVDRAYLDAIGLRQGLKEDHERFTIALVAALHAWSRRVAQETGLPEMGLPVGFPAARLVANVALSELDRVLVQGLVPLYYGRYVDDLLLVLEDTQGASSQVDVWNLIASRSRGLLVCEASSSEIVVRFDPPYLRGSDVRFLGEKQKIFVLEGTTGKDLVDCIDRQIRHRSSEWRSLPDLPDGDDRAVSDALGARDKDGVDADNLRKADSLSARRAEFAIALRDAEAFARDLAPEAWAEHRRRFFTMVETYLLALPALFDYEAYLQRIIGLAIACGDYQAACDFLSRLRNTVERIGRDCEVFLLDDRGSPEVLERWRAQLARGLTEASAASIPQTSGRARGALSRLLAGLKAIGTAGGAHEFNSQGLSARSRDLFGHDLARTPYRYSFFPDEYAYGIDADTANAAVTLTSEEATAWLPSVLCDGVRSFLHATRQHGSHESVPLALLFPTRPFDTSEFHFVVPALWDQAPGQGGGSRSLRAWGRAFRGVVLRSVPWRDGKLLRVPHQAEDARICIGLTSWTTNVESWKAAVVGSPDPDLGRYSRLNRLLNQALVSPTRPRYLVLPELSVPPRWFFGIASKLAKSGVSLVCGVEYLHVSGRSIANQVWASLVTDFSGNRSFVVYRQDKQRAALHEESELWKIGGKRLKPQAQYREPPRIRHGDFLFAILICSELTDIKRRAALRGEVDALFVPEWNKDTETFSSIVEAAALDVHAYIVQCNDRRYGDTRIRGPAKDPWRRDLVKVKGGVDDYLVIGELDVEALRRFQSHHRSPVECDGSEAEFKPVPDGFMISDDRRRLPG